MARIQVRLDPDVAEALGVLAEESERSVSAEANLWLRRALGLGSAPRVIPPTSSSVRAPQGRLNAR